jgi:hypothetical protein
MRGRRQGAVMNKERGQNNWHNKKCGPHNHQGYRQHQRKGELDHQEQ